MRATHMAEPSSDACGDRCNDQTNNLDCVSGLDSSGVQGRFEALAQSDSIDKATALEMMALHHEIQTQHIKICHAMEREIDGLKYEITTMERTHRYSEMFAALTGDVALLQKQVREICEKLAEGNNRRR